MAVCEGGLLLRELCLRGLAIVDESLKTNHLHRVDSYLTMSHIGYLQIIEYLNVSLSHLHTDIILCLLEVGCCCLEIQLVELYLVRDLETCEEGHTRTKL